ncbi:MAG: glycosyltransferase [Rhodospirillales bacterium]|nr:glycosyltransferase [Rhodospirillales bacterium]
MTISIAVLIPCFNEALTIAKVITDFRKALPDGDIYVYDNNSTDGTVAEAKKAGAIVRTEPQQGKGHVVRRMFADIDADIYVMADGDDTYDASRAQDLVSCLIDNQLDMVVGSRSTEDHRAHSRAGHRLGNEVLTQTVRRLFGRGVTDMLSGYRIFSRRFVKSFPAIARGFEIETEITVHALQMGLPIDEVETNYFDRPAGSTSKLNTYRDGLRILNTIFLLFRDNRPLLFFGAGFLLFASFSIILAGPVFGTYMDTGLVPRLPTAILATGAMLLGFLSLACGLILDSVSRGRLEAKRLRYLSIGKS